jgi:hypothetical protein
MLGHSWVSERLVASEKGFSSMEWVKSQMKFYERQQLSRYQFTFMYHFRRMIQIQTELLWEISGDLNPHTPHQKPVHNRLCLKAVRPTSASSFLESALRSELLYYEFVRLDWTNVRLFRSSSAIRNINCIYICLKSEQYSVSFFGCHVLIKFPDQKSVLTEFHVFFLEDDSSLYIIPVNRRKHGIFKLETISPNLAYCDTQTRC